MQSKISFCFDCVLFTQNILVCPYHLTKYPTTRRKKDTLHSLYMQRNIMKKTVIVLFLLSFSSLCFAQNDSSKWVRAFPVTDYMVELSDSVKLVQVHLPNGPVLKEKQMGLLRGVYNTAHSDTSMIGSGRCNLIKGDYYYFTIDNKTSRRIPKENDLLYTVVDRPVVYNGRIIKIASHFISLQSVYEEPLYDRYTVFQKWSGTDERACIDSMTTDIQLTGDYFLKNNPSMNVKIPGGKYNGQMVLNVMIKCNSEDVKDFLDYIIARPRLYAGKEWKISETFATWLSSGAPTVIKE